MASQLNGFEWYRIDLPCLAMIVSQLNQTEFHHIDSIKVTLNRLTMMLCDDSESTESNRIASYRFNLVDVEQIDHDTLR